MCYEAYFSYVLLVCKRMSVKSNMILNKLQPNLTGFSALKEITVFKSEAFARS